MNKDNSEDISYFEDEYGFLTIPMKRAPEIDWIAFRKWKKENNITEDLTPEQQKYVEEHFVIDPGEPYEEFKDL
jgi:hypothetical protein